ncbi:MAG: UDP-N-acetylmuramoyl-L-alanine--D-glutamate ligase [Legionellales bacterium]|nr:UDP-N-acetylmuramoyl-L-alanine--D-glutamate ligase [Legionellales bacterium]|tara:strand:+ start:477 stop:1814 length:1338 start_codon:yes stop_codon:yes gene_type:complete
MSNLSYAVLGLGKTGASCARWLFEQGYQVTLHDDRADPPEYTSFKALGLDIPMYLGAWNDEVIAAADHVVVSPGISPNHAIIQSIQMRGQSLISDLDLFLMHTAARVLLVTGTNGKSTVVTILGELLASAGFNVRVGGNIGLPALDCLAPTLDWVVLECSSFTLHYTQQLRSDASMVLNVEPDHLDWHSDFKSYRKDKLRIYEATQYAIWPETLKPYIRTTSSDNRCDSIVGSDTDHDWCVQPSGQIDYQGRCVVNAQVISKAVQGAHMNIAMACAMAYSAGVPIALMQEVIESFKGLPHRYEYLGCHAGVDWYDDSKATNTPAMLAAVQTAVSHYAESGVVLLLGGQLKLDDWRSACSILKGYPVTLIVFGAGREVLSSLFSSIDCPCLEAETLSCAVDQAWQVAQPGQAVLLSPGGSSFDEFEHFEARGQAFQAYLKAKGSQR